MPTLIHDATEECTATCRGLRVELRRWRKRSRRRTRDLVTQAASQGLSENEIGCARISMMARSTNAPCKGRIQMRKTNPLHFFTFGLQRTAGPYRWVRLGSRATQSRLPLFPQQQTFKSPAVTSDKCQKPTSITFQETSKYCLTNTCHFDIR
jgi:hypothetical protein